MIKIFVLVSAFFISFAVNASGETICPSSLTCDYETGVCDRPSGWALDTGRAVEDFSGQNTMELSKIVGYKESLSDPYPYSIRCGYSYGEHSVVSIYTYVKSLTGANWVFSGFGNNKAECSDATDPTSCSGADQINGTIAHKVHLQQLYTAASLTEATPCGNACKRKTFKVRDSATVSYCLPQPESPSGWGWVTDGNPQAALPLCECHPGGNRKNRYWTYCS